MQAHIDAELSPAERLVVEQHVAECPQCAALLREFQAVSVLLFETLADDRLPRSLAMPVMHALPEMAARDRGDLAGVNWRAKHPSSRAAAMMRRIPIAAAVVLTVLAVVIQYNWPERPVPNASVIGVLTQVTGDAYHKAASDASTGRAALKAFIEPGATLRTGSNGTMMAALAGPTYLKLNRNSRLVVTSDRRFALEHGEAWLNVGRNGRRFVVHTPSGDVRVLGTAFVVQADANATTVTVTEGEVHLESAVDRQAFVVVTRGRRATISRSGSPAGPTDASVRTVTAWAEAIVPDREAHTLFLDAVQSRAAGALELPGMVVWRIPTTQGDEAWAVSALRIYWDPTPATARHCSYEVYVYDGNMRPLFRDHVDGSVFGDADGGYYEVRAPTGPIRDVNALTVRLVPDFSTGPVEPTLSVKALAH